MWRSKGAIYRLLQAGELQFHYGKLESKQKWDFRCIKQKQATREEIKPAELVMSCSNSKLMFPDGSESGFNPTFKSSFHCNCATPQMP
jgi:hypothetical protein